MIIFYDEATLTPTNVVFRCAKAYLDWARSESSPPNVITRLGASKDDIELRRVEVNGEEQVQAFSVSTGERIE